MGKISDLARELRNHAVDDHTRGCGGRMYSCECGYDLKTERLLRAAAQRIEQLEAFRPGGRTGVIFTRADRFALPRSGDGADLRGGQARKNIAAMARTDLAVAGCLRLVWRRQGFASRATDGHVVLWRT